MWKQDLWQSIKSCERTEMEEICSLSLDYITVQFSSVAQSCLILCDPMNRSTPGLSVHHKLPEFTQTHIHGVGDGQGGLACCDSWDRKEPDRTEWLNWTELKLTKVVKYFKKFKNHMNDLKEGRQGRKVEHEKKE